MPVFRRLLGCLSGSSIIILNSVENPGRLNQGLHKESYFSQPTANCFWKMELAREEMKGRGKSNHSGGPLLWVGSGDLHQSLEQKIKWSSWSLNRRPDFRMETVIWKMSLHVPCVLFVLLGRWRCEFVCGCVCVCVCVWCELYTGLYPVHKGTSMTTQSHLSFSLWTTSNTGSTKQIHNKPGTP